MMDLPSTAPTPMRGESLSLIGVRKRYGDFLAVDGISLDVPAGALLTLLGPSGCGKSTLLRMIAGFVTASEGRITLNGRDVLDVPPYKRETAMVFQSYALFPHMTILENVMFGLKMRRVPRDVARKRALETLDMVRLTALAERHPSQLSGGQQQRAALARALVTNPKVLLLDEPFGALDKSLRDEMQVELRKLQLAVGVTTVCVTHDQQEAMTISDMIAVMKEGRIEQVGTPVSIYDKPQTRFVANFIGTSNNLSGVVGAPDISADTELPVERRTSALTAPVLLQGGGKLRIPVKDCPPPGSPVEIAIRPSAVRLRAPGHGTEAGNARLQGRIGFATNLGDKVNYEVTIAGEIKVIVDAQRHAGEPIFAKGDAVDLLIDAQDCMVLSA